MTLVIELMVWFLTNSKISKFNSKKKLEIIEKVRFKSFQILITSHGEK